MANLAHVSIIGLHGMRTVEVPFRGRHCVLIGPNGTGKSTALQIIAYTLGRQWRRLEFLQFSEIELTFDNGQKANLKQSDCKIFGLIGRRGMQYSSNFLSSVDPDLFSALLSSNLSNDIKVANLSERLNISVSDIKRMQRRFTSDPAEKAAQKRLSELIDCLDSNFKTKLIYLPTYRRIELELKQIIEDVPEPYRRSIEQKQKKENDDQFITEIVRFGMDDIQKRISSFENETRDFARNQFNRMMASYIKEMANSNVISVTELRNIYVDPKQISITLSRIEEGLLDEAEKSQISEIIMELVEGKAGGHPPFYKKWLAHFYSRLFSVNKQLEDVEKPIRTLVETLNRYLFPKIVDYDIEKYHFSIKDEYQREISLSDLSSGEKQIVSILTELYFRKDDFSIFVDEPELSLSVPWQVDFLQDISKSEHCRQVVAVTHSPFIYDNSFSSSVVDFSI